MFAQIKFSHLMTGYVLQMYCSEVKSKPFLMHARHFYTSKTQMAQTCSLRRNSIIARFILQAEATETKGSAQTKKKCTVTTQTCTFLTKYSFLPTVRHLLKYIPSFYRVDFAKRREGGRCTGNRIGFLCSSFFRVSLVWVHLGGRNDAMSYSSGFFVPPQYPPKNRGLTTRRQCCKRTRDFINSATHCDA